MTDRALDHLLSHSLREAVRRAELRRQGVVPFGRRDPQREALEDDILAIVDRARELDASKLTPTKRVHGVEGGQSGQAEPPTGRPAVSRAAHHRAAEPPHSSGPHPSLEGQSSASAVVSLPLGDGRRGHPSPELAG